MRPEYYFFLHEVLPPMMEEILEPPIGDPDECVPVEFAFRENVRDWWNRVAGHKCQYEYYDEKRGWVECGEKSEQVHHILPEGWQLDNGLDPEHSAGLPLCRHHHMNFSDKTFTPEEHSKNFSFHPDMGKARQDYRSWKQQKIQLSLSPTAAVNLPPDPYTQAVKGHRALTEKGERFWAGTEDIDNFYREKMELKAQLYVFQTHDQRPSSAPHHHHDPSKKRNWYDGFFEE